VQYSWPPHMKNQLLVSCINWRHVCLSLPRDRSADQHDIIPNGYNLGRWVKPSINLPSGDPDGNDRDWLVGNITQSPVPTLNLTNGTTYSATTSSEGYTYKTDVLYISGLLENTNFGINHNISVGVDGVNSVDGFLAVLDISITQTPPKTSYVFFRNSSFPTLRLNLPYDHMQSCVARVTIFAMAPIMLRFSDILPFACTATIELSLYFSLQTLLTWVAYPSSYSR
jgi:hypothetical protein